MDYTFVHAADIHLDSPLSGLEKYEGAPAEAVRRATRDAFDNLVDLCLEEEARFLIIAGDLFDGDWRDYSTGLYFARAMGKLRDAGIPVYIVRGNHDAASQVTRSLRLPGNVHIFDHNQPESKILEEAGTVLHGHSFARQSVTEDLSLKYPAPLPGFLNIGVLHTSAGGRPGHENYAPCSGAYLANKGYHYWALGHVHRREVLEREDPWIVFPGNLQGRHIRETGEKGASLVRVSGGRIQSVEHRTLDVLRWHLCQVDICPAETVDDIIPRAQRQLEDRLATAPELLHAVRLQISGRTPLHPQVIRERQRIIHDLRALVVDYWPEQVWLEKVLTDTRDERPAGAAGRHSLFSNLEQAAEQHAQDPGKLKELVKVLDSLEQELPPELKQAEIMQLLQDGERAREMIRKSADLVMQRLLEVE